MMTEAKKIWLWGAVVIAVAAAVTWAIWPEYGKGYSEDQRRNWNKMASWENGRDYGNKVSFLTSSLEHRQSQSDVPVWKLEIPDGSGSRLPLEGMGVTMLKHLASGGDGRACLELVFRSFDDGSFYGDGFCFPDFSSVYQAETYGKKAEEMGTPGASFLFRLIEARKRNGDAPDVRNLDGYDSFLSLLDEGDFLLGKIYLYLNPNGEEALTRLEIGLKRKVGKGDTVALRNLAHLRLLRQIRGTPDSTITYTLYSKSEISARSFHENVSECLGTLIRILPFWKTQMEEVDKSLLTWLEAREWKSARRRLKAPIVVLGEAAAGGDVHAKYLWCMYMEACQQSFSREEWENYLRYVDELLKSGGIYRGAQAEYFQPARYTPVRYFYEGESIWKVMELLNLNSDMKLAFLCPGSAVSQKERAIKRAAMESMEIFARFLYLSFYTVEKEREYGFNLVARAAEDGDPCALYYMSRMLNEGFLGKTDGKRAWDFLQKLKTWRKGINGKLASESFGQDRRKNKDNFFFGHSFSDSVDIQELDIVSRHGDMPGMTVKEAFENFLAMHSRKKDSYPPFDEMLQPSGVKEQFEKRGFKIPDEPKGD